MTTIETNDLLPCPFCGGTQLRYHEDISEDDPKRHYAFHVFCTHCHCHGRNGYPIGWCETIEMAKEAWNDRSSQSSSPVTDAIALMQDIADSDSHGRYGRQAREAIEALRRPAQTPLSDPAVAALSDMMDVYEGIATALSDIGVGWNGFRGKHLEQISAKVKAAKAVLAAHARCAPTHVAWKDEDYNKARDCMIGLLRGHGWTISEGSRGVKEFDNAFQHAVGILALSAVPSTERRDVCAGGVNPGWDECEKCGATADDECAFTSTDGGGT